MNLNAVVTEPPALVLRATSNDGGSTIRYIPWSEFRSGEVGTQFYVAQYGVADRIYDESATIVYRNTDGCAVLITKTDTKNKSKEQELQWFQFLNPLVKNE